MTQPPVARRAKQVSGARRAGPATGAAAGMRPRRSSAAPSRAAGDLLTAGTRRLRRIAGAAARLEAEMLLGRVLGRSRVWLMARPEFPVPGPAARRFRVMVRRRADHAEPVAYLTGAREFAGLDFVVRRGVLIPRPETEGLLERVEAWLRTRPAGYVVDAGTGSGALAVALAKRTGRRVVATDVSAVAVRVARGNAARHGVGDRVDVRRGSWLAPLRRNPPPGAMLAVMSNPPYVSDRLMRRLPADVREEPRGALAAGPDGLAAIRRVIAQARAHLEPGGLLALEIGAEQGRAVTRLLGEGWTEVRIDRDLTGRPRYALAVRARNPAA